MSEEPIPEADLGPVFEAIRDRQAGSGVPALTRSELDDVLGELDRPVDVDALVAERQLGCFEPGDDRVYWAADENLAGGYVDVAPAAVTADRAQTDEGTEAASESTESDDGDEEDPTWWQRQYGLGDTLLRMSALLFAVGLGIIFADGPGLSGVDLSEAVLETGEFFFIVAIPTVVIASLLMAVCWIGHRAADRGWLPAEPGGFLPM